MATDLTDAYRHGMTELLDHARKMADPFTSSESPSGAWTLFAGGYRTNSSGIVAARTIRLYKTRKILLTGDERLTGRTVNGSSRAYA